MSIDLGFSIIPISFVSFSRHVINKEHGLLRYRKNVLNNPYHKIREAPNEQGRIAQYARIMAQLLSTISGDGNRARHLLNLTKESNYFLTIVDPSN